MHPDAVLDPTAEVSEGTVTAPTDVFPLMLTLPAVETSDPTSIRPADVLLLHDRAPLVHLLVGTGVGEPGQA